MAGGRIIGDDGRPWVPYTAPDPAASSRQVGRGEPGRQPRSPWLVAVVAAVCAAIMASLGTAGVMLALQRGGGVATVPGVGGAALDIGSLLSRAQPSVVTIQAGEQAGGIGGTGSGLIISSDGDVLTNAHVVQGRGTVRVRLHDGRDLPADLVGSFPDADVAMVRIRDVSGLTPAELGSADDVEVGDPVVAIGNALNLGGPPTVTTGILSATGRVVEAEGGIVLRDLLQTDAAINPGNSGGPLLDAEGRVIGINTAIAANSQGIGFAISIDTVKPLVEDLRAGRGELSPDDAMLGVTALAVSSLTTEGLDRFGITASWGAVVQEVSPGSAAEAAGLAPGDVIVAIDGQQVDNADSLGEVVRSYRPGDRVVVRFEREGRVREVTAELQSRAGG